MNYYMGLEFREMRIEMRSKGDITYRPSPLTMI